MISQFKHLLLFIALIFFAAPQCSKAANILAFLPTSSPSHLIIEMAAVRAMAERQHNVTVLSVLNLKSEWLHPNMKHIKLDKGLVNMNQIINITKMKGLQKYRKFLDVFKIIILELALVLDDPIYQELLNNPANKFELMMFGYMFGDYFFGIAEHFNCPVVMLWPNIPIVPIMDIIGNPLEISYTVSTLFNEVTDDAMGFMFRLKNVMAVAIERFRLSLQNSIEKEIYVEHFPPDKYASYEKAKERLAIVFFSHHFSEKPIRPLVPAMIEIGGIHINDQPKALSEDLEVFINSAEHGVIFFSMGTNVKEHHMQPHALNKIFNVLSKLPQKVLWKIDDESKLPGNSSNILYRKWLPQSDILGHSNIKLFFGHGGKGGITEAKFYGVPMVGLPIFGDQPMNMNEVVTKGYGLSINHAEPLTYEIIYKTVLEVLTNPIYAYNVKQFSLLYRDRPLTAKDNAVYWLEYVLRYKGAPHMQSPLRNMSLFEATNFDVIVFILVALVIVCKLVKLLIKFAVKSIYRMLGKKVKRD